METHKIYESISKIMSEVAPISKNRQGQGYKFRGIDDAYLALQPLMAKYGVFTVPTVLDERSEERTSKSGGHLIYRILKMKYDFFSAIDGSSVSTVVMGESMDSSDKACNKAMSVAHKYALLQIFMIPTEEPKDPENPSEADHGVLPKQTYEPEPAEVAVYGPTAEQKTQLKANLAKIGITDPAEIAIVNKLCTGQPITALFKIVTDYKNSKTAGVQNAGS